MAAVQLGCSGTQASKVGCSKDTDCREPRVCHSRPGTRRAPSAENAEMSSRIGGGCVAGTGLRLPRPVALQLDAVAEAESALELSGDDSFHALVPGDLAVERVQALELDAVLALPCAPGQQLWGEFDEPGFEICQLRVMADDV